MAIGTLWMFKIEVDNKGEEYARTMAFFTIAAFQLFHVMAIRKERQSAFLTNPATNKFLILAIIGTYIGQVVITYVSPLNTVFKNVPIHFSDLVLCTLIASSVFFAVEIEKAFYRKREARM